MWRIQICLHVYINGIYFTVKRSWFNGNFLWDISSSSFSIENYFSTVYNFLCISVSNRSLICAVFMFCLLFVNILIDLVIRTPCIYYFTQKSVCYILFVLTQTKWDWIFGLINSLFFLSQFSMNTLIVFLKNVYVATVYTQFLTSVFMKKDFLCYMLRVGRSANIRQLGEFHRGQIIGLRETLLSFRKVAVRVKVLKSLYVS